MSQISATAISLRTQRLWLPTCLEQCISERYCPTAQWESVNVIASKVHSVWHASPDALSNPSQVQTSQGHLTLSPDLRMPPLKVKDLTCLSPPSMSTVDSKHVPQVLCRWYRSQKGQYEDEAMALNPPLLQDLATPTDLLSRQNGDWSIPIPLPPKKEKKAQSRSRWEVTLLRQPPHNGGSLSQVQAIILSTAAGE